MGDGGGTAGQGEGDPWRQQGGVNMWEERRWTERKHILERPGPVWRLFVWVIKQPHTSTAPLSLSAVFTHWFSQQDSHWHWMDGANLTQGGTALSGLQVSDGAPSTHSPHLIFRQIFITINLAWLCDIKILRIDNLSLENRSWAPAGPSGSVSLRHRPDQMKKVTLVAHRTWYLISAAAAELREVLCILIPHNGIWKARRPREEEGCHRATKWGTGFNNSLSSFWSLFFNTISKCHYSTFSLIKHRTSCNPFASAV